MNFEEECYNFTHSALQVPFTFIIDDPESSAKVSMSNPLLKEVQKKLTDERCEELVLAMQRALENSKLEDGMCGKNDFFSFSA